MPATVESAALCLAIVASSALSNSRSTARSCVNGSGVAGYSSSDARRLVAVVGTLSRARNCGRLSAAAHRVRRSLVRSAPIFGRLAVTAFCTLPTLPSASESKPDPIRAGRHGNRYRGAVLSGRGWCRDRRAPGFDKAFLTADRETQLNRPAHRTRYRHVQLQ